MTGWQINKEGKTELVSKAEMLDEVDSVKVKITRALVTEEDIAVISGEGKAVTLPIIPCRMAVGQIAELASASDYFKKGDRVCISPIKACGTCYHCLNDKEHECSDFKIAGLNTDGFLKDFALVKTSDIFLLPSTVKESDAIYIEYVSLALSVIDKLNVDKGQHVAIFGSSVFASALAQLIIYYQGVPILIDEDENALLLARKSGVYYTVKAGAQAEKEVTSITGGRMVHKVVYTSRSNASVDLAFKLASPFGRFAFAGFSYPALKAPINVALRKQLSCVCITSGYGNTETAINALANKAVDFSNYALTATDMKDIPANLDNMMLAFKDKRPVGNLLINMLG